MKKKKILTLLPGIVAYGKERANIEVYHLLQNSGKYDVKVLANNKSNHRIIELLSGLDVQLFTYPDRHDEFFSICSYIINVICANVRLLVLLVKIKPDVLFINSELTCYDLFWSLMCYRGKIVFRLGDAPAYPNLKYYYANSWMWKKLCVRKVCTFVFISKFVQKALEATGRNTRNDSLIYNYPPARNNIKKQIPTNNHRSIVFGYIGQICKHKGVDIFIKAAKQMLLLGYDCSFCIAGDLGYDASFGNSIELMVSNEPRIRLLGEVEDVDSFYRGIDVLVVPSVYEEPLSNTIVEAKQNYRPSLIFPSGGMPEIITHEVDGFVCKDKTQEALCEGMKFYLDNPNLLFFHKQNAYDSIVKLGIDRTVFERKWLEVFSRF